MNTKTDSNTKSSEFLFHSMRSINLNTSSPFLRQTQTSRPPRCDAQKRPIITHTQMQADRSAGGGSREEKARGVSSARRRARARGQVIIPRVSHADSSRSFSPSAQARDIQAVHHAQQPVHSRNDGLNIAPRKARSRTPRYLLRLESQDDCPPRSGEKNGRRRCAGHARRKRARCTKA